MAARGARASVTPRPVATPLPPRKRSQTGKQWPTTAATPQAAPRDDESADFEAKKAGKKPFRASSSSVETAAVRPAARATLVAPMFPDPIARTSRPEASFAMKRPNGIEPARYDPATPSAK